VWDSGNLKLQQSLEGHDSNVNSVTISNDAKNIASGDWNGVTKIWRKASRPGGGGKWECKFTLKDHESGEQGGGVHCLTYRYVSDDEERSVEY